MTDKLIQTFSRRQLSRLLRNFKYNFNDNHKDKSADSEKKSNEMTINFKICFKYLLVCNVKLMTFTAYYNFSS